MEISRERRSPTKLLEWTGPSAGTKEDGKKTEAERMDGWLVGWMKDRSLMTGECRLLFGRCALRQTLAYRGGRRGFFVFCGSAFIKEYLEDVGVKAIVLTSVFCRCRRARSHVHRLSIPVLVAGPACTVSWHVSAALGCEPR